MCNLAFHIFSFELLSYSKDSIPGDNKRNILSQGSIFLRKNNFCMIIAAYGLITYQHPEEPYCYDPMSSNCEHSVSISISSSLPSSKHDVLKCRSLAEGMTVNHASSTHLKNLSNMKSESSQMRML